MYKCENWTEKKADRKKLIYSKYVTTFHNSMYGTGEHYSKWNKPGGERQILYDLTCKWNLINKTNKQVKYNQRHWNKEQTYSSQREGGRGIMGENRGKVIKEHV